jgi:hypothetical protein
MEIWDSQSPVAYFGRGSLLREEKASVIISCFAMENYLWMRKHGDGSPTYSLSEWVHLNAVNSTAAVREYISVYLWGGA